VGAIRTTTISRIICSAKRLFRRVAGRYSAAGASARPMRESFLIHQIGARWTALVRVNDGRLPATSLGALPTTWRASSARRGTGRRSVMAADRLASHPVGCVCTPIVSFVRGREAKDRGVASAPRATCLRWTPPAGTEGSSVTLLSIAQPSPSDSRHPVSASWFGRRRILERLRPPQHHSWWLRSQLDYRRQRRNNLPQQS